MAPNVLAQMMLVWTVTAATPARLVDDADTVVDPSDAEAIDRLNERLLT